LLSISAIRQRIEAVFVTNLENLHRLPSEFELPIISTTPLSLPDNPAK
jgi:hypothetical protein